MKTKLRIMSFALLVLLTFANVANAAIEFNTDDGEVFYENLDQMSKELNSEVFQIGTMDVDLRDLPEKSVNKSINLKNPPLVILRSNPVNTSKIKCTWAWPSQYANTLATSSSTVNEDEIYAKCRVYNSVGSLLGQEDNRDYNDSFTSATVMENGYSGRGNHEYFLAGYNDVYHTTLDYY